MPRENSATPAVSILDRPSSFRVKILDFGLARALEGQGDLTSPGGFVGTPGYLAPEQARGEPVDARSDLFSLGCVLYRMVTGQLPFRGTTMMAQLASLAAETPPPAHEVNPQVKPELSGLIRKLLVKNAGERPASAEAVVEQLRQLERDPAWPEPCPSPARPPRWKNRLKTLVASLAAAALVLAGIIITIKVRKPDGTEVTVEIKTTPTEPGKDTKPAPRETKPEPNLPKPLPASKDPEVALSLRAVNTACFTADGKTILASAYIPLPGMAGTRGKEKVYSIEGEREFVGEEVDVIHRIASSPDSKWYTLAGGDPYREGLLLLRSADRKQTIRLPGHRGEVLGGAFSPDGKRLASSGRDVKIRVWDVQTQKLSFELDGHERGCRTLAFHPGGKQQLASAGDDGLRLWDLGTKKSIHCRHDSAFEGVAYTPDGSRLVTVGHDGGIRLWDSATGKALDLLGTAEVPQGEVCVTRDGRHVLSGDWKSGQPCRVRVWDLEKKKPVRTFEAHRDLINTMMLSPDGKLLLTTSANEEAAKVWKFSEWLEGRK